MIEYPTPNADKEILNKLKEENSMSVNREESIEKIWHK
jgi:hypothetical protein